MTSVREACHCRERVPVGRFAVANGGAGRKGFTQEEAFWLRS